MISKTTEYMELCGLAQIDEKRMWQCLVSGEAKAVGRVLTYPLDGQLLGV